MSKFRGARLPRDLPRELRRVLKHHDRAMQTLEDPRSLDWGSIAPRLTDVDDDGTAAKASGGATPASSVRRVIISGSQISGQLARGQAGEIVLLQFKTAGVQPARKHGLRLPDDFFHGAGDLLMLAWDGRQWVEVSRTGGARTLVNVNQFGAMGDGNECAASVQRAFDSITDSEEDNTTSAADGRVGAGGVVFFPKSNLGEYLIGTPINIYSQNTLVLFENGVRIRKYDLDETTPDSLPLFKVQGYKNTTATETAVTASVATSDLTLTVASGDEANFSTDDYIFIEDDEADFDGGSNVHGEINRVRSTADGVITLYWPVSDAYSTGTINVTQLRGETTANTQRTIPRNVTFQGGAILSNYDTTSDGGGAGIRVQYAIDVNIQGLRFDRCKSACIQVTGASNVRISDCHFQNGTHFDGSVGYGITATTSNHVTVTACNFERMRHAVDASYFSLHTTVTGCHIRGSASHALMAHSNTKYLRFLGNTIDGTVGHDANSGSGKELTITGGAGDSFGAGINVNAQTKYALIDGNTIINTQGTGIWVHIHLSDFITVSNNHLRNINVQDITAVGALAGGISCLQNNGAAANNARQGIRIVDNILTEVKGFGIAVGADDTVVSGNYLANITGGTNSPGIQVRTYNAGGGASEQTVSRVRVEGNWVTGVTGASRASGIAVQAVGIGTGAANTDIYIDSNLVHGCSYHGIVHEDVGLAGRIAIRNNVVLNCNLVNSASYAGISVAEWTSGDGTTHEQFLVQGNYVHNCRNGIMAGLDFIMIKDNIVHDASIIGIYVLSRHVAGDTLRGVQVVGNYVYKAGVWGIYGGTSVGGEEIRTIIKDNHVVQCGREGINLLAGHDDAIIEGNYVDGNATAGTYAGIHVAGDRTIIRNNILVDNQSTPTQNYGINIDATATATRIAGNIFRDHTTGPFIDSGSDTVWEDPVIPASWWGVEPGVADNTTAMQAALDECPVEKTLQLPPGQIDFTGTGGLSCTRGINIDGQGALLHWGSTVLTAPAFTWDDDQATRASARHWMKDLQIERTYGPVAGTRASYTGLQLLATLEFEVKNVLVRFFEVGIHLKGGTARGCIHNRVVNCHTTSCHKHLYLQAGTDGGWCNENMFMQHRVQQSITEAAEVANIHSMVHLHYEAAASNNLNNNTFLHCNFEMAEATQYGVKIEGTDNYFLFCRWEGMSEALQPVSIGNTDYTAANWRGNVFLWGNEMDNLIDTAGYIEYLDSASTGLNYDNRFFRDRRPATITASTLTVNMLHGDMDFDCSSNAITATLPAAAGQRGEEYTFSKIDSSSNALTIAGDGSDTINGATTLVLTTQWDSVTLRSNGTEWRIV